MNSIDSLYSPSYAFIEDKMIHLVGGGHFPVGYKNDKQLFVILSFPHLDLVWDNDPGKSAYFGDPNHPSGEIFLESWWDLRMEGYQSHLAFTLNFLMSAWSEITLNILHPFVLGS